MAALTVGGGVSKGKKRETPSWAMTVIIVTDDGDLVLGVEMVKVVRFWLYLEGSTERIC